MTRLLQESVSRQADSRPEAPAIVDGPARITYGELELRTNRLAHYLKAAACREGDRVGILVPKSIAAITGILAALKAGCMYVPLDCSSPASRLYKIVRVCECRVILSVGPGREELQRLITADRGEAAWLDPDDPNVNAMPAGPPDCRRRPSDVAHILFTSGSTGTPKGVMITHANVLAFLDWALPYFGHQRTDRISSHPPLHFDLSTFDIFGTLSAGACLCLIPPALSLLPHKLAEAMRTLELTQWFSVPSVLNYMARFQVVRDGDFPSLKRLLWCGEPFPTPALIYWMRRLPHVTFTNLYGPTETTIASSYYRVPRCPDHETEQIPVGSPCRGEELLVLDGDLHPVGVRVMGDLYIRGAGLSPGYWKDAEKTERAFVQDPFSEDPQARIYRTGDLATMDEKGMVYLHGRADAQVKSRGYRIELGEIEAALHVIDGIRECAVTAIPSDGFEGHAICCAFSAADGRLLTPQLLRRRLGETLPAYMIPSRWMEMERLPLNGNGKIDRPAIRDRFVAETAPRASGMGGEV